MPRKRSETLTDGELKLMKVLWAKERATVGEVVTALSLRRRPAYNTVLTMLRILEDKGYARHKKEGRAFVYMPVIDRNMAQRSAVKRLLRQLFDDSPGSLVLNVLEHEQVDADEAAHVRELLEETQ